MTTDQQSALRAGVIDLHSAYAPLHPIMRSSKRLSLNAAIASAQLGQAGLPFSVVAKTFGTMVGNLDERIRALEGVSGELAALVAKWIRVETELRIYGGVLERKPAQAEAVSPAGATGDGPATLPAASAQAGRTDLLRTLLLERVSGKREVLAELLTGVAEGVQRIAREMQTVQRVAVRQSRFTALSAKIESARVSTGSGTLGAVALDMLQLSDEIAKVERSVNEQISELHARVNGHMSLAR